MRFESHWFSVENLMNHVRMTHELRGKGHVLSHRCRGEEDRCVSGTHAGLLVTLNNEMRKGLEGWLSR